MYCAGRDVEINGNIVKNLNENDLHLCRVV